MVREWVWLANQGRYVSLALIFSAFVCFKSARAQEQAEVVLSDFEDGAGGWKGVTVTREDVRHGTSCGLWDTSEVTSASLRLPDGDWSRFGEISVWLRVEGGDEPFVLRTEVSCARPGTPDPDGFLSTAIVTGGDWQEVVLPFWGFSAIGHPVDWHAVRSVSFSLEPAGLQAGEAGRASPLVRIDHLAVRQAGEPDRVVLGDMDHDVVRWGGLELSAAEARSGRFAGLWEDTVGTPWIHTRCIPHDWSRFSVFRFSAFSADDTPRSLRVRIYPNEPGRDYTSYYHTVQLVGGQWEDFEIPFWDFDESGTPNGWGKITALTIIAGGEVEFVEGRVYIDDVCLATADAVDSVVLLDEDVRRWPKLQMGTDNPQVGSVCGVWGDPNQIPWVECLRVPADWRPFDHLRFWAWSDEPNGQEVRVRLHAQGPEGEPGSYWSAFTVTWNGWQEIVLPLWAFEAAGKPAGWDRITRMVMCAGGGEVPTQPNTYLALDEVRLEKADEAAAATGDVVLLDDTEVARWRGVIPTSEQVASGGVSAKWGDLSQPPAIRSGMVPRDWSAAASLELSICNPGGKPVNLWVFVESDGPATEQLDGYRKVVLVDWREWRTLLLELDGFRPVGAPAGWSAVGAIRIIGGDWGLQAPPDSTLYLDRVLLHGGLRQGASGGEPHGQLTLLDEEVDRWQRLTLSGEGAHSGERCALWGDPREVPFVVCDWLPEDWTSYGSLSLAVWSQSANGQEVRVRLHSGPKGEGTSGSYWSAFSVTWEGWRQIEIPVWAFEPAGKPQGWHCISDLALCAGGEVPTREGTYLKLDDIVAKPRKPEARDESVVLLEDVEVARWRGLDPSREKV
jgi:hypothetical protein